MDCRTGKWNPGCRPWHPDGMTHTVFLRTTTVRNRICKGSHPGSGSYAALAQAQRRCCWIIIWRKYMLLNPPKSQFRKHGVLFWWSYSVPRFVQRVPQKKTSYVRLFCVLHVTWHRTGVVSWTSFSCRAMRGNSGKSHVLVGKTFLPQIWCDCDRASSLICGNKMPTRCNRGFYCRSYCLLNMFRAPLCPSSGAQEYYTVVVACGISCCGFQVAVCSMLQHPAKRTHNHQLHTTPTTWKPKHEIPQAATTV